MTRAVNPHLEAIAFRVWQHCTPLDWDCYASDVAEALDLGIGEVRAAMVYKGMTGRMRTRTYHGQVHGVGFHSYDNILDGYSNRQAVAALVGGAV